MSQTSIPDSIGSRVERVRKSNVIYYYSVKLRKIFRMTNSTFKKMSSCDICVPIYSSETQTSKPCSNRAYIFSAFKAHIFDVEKRYKRPLVWTSRKETPDEKLLYREREIGDLINLKDEPVLKLKFDNRTLIDTQQNLLYFFRTNGCLCSKYCSVKGIGQSRKSMLSHLCRIEKEKGKCIVFKGSEKEIKRSKQNVIDLVSSSEDEEYDNDEILLIDQNEQSRISSTNCDLSIDNCESNSVYDLLSCSPLPIISAEYAQTALATLRVIDKNQSPIKHRKQGNEINRSINQYHYNLSAVNDNQIETEHQVDLWDSDIENYSPSIDRNNNRQLINEEEAYSKESSLINDCKPGSNSKNPGQSSNREPTAINYDQQPEVSVSCDFIPSYSPTPSPVYVGLQTLYSQYSTINSYPQTINYSSDSSLNPMLNSYQQINYSNCSAFNSYNPPIINYPCQPAFNYPSMISYSHFTSFNSYPSIFNHTFHCLPPSPPPSIINYPLSSPESNYSDLPMVNHHNSTEHGTPNKDLSELEDVSLLSDYMPPLEDILKAFKDPAERRMVLSELKTNSFQEELVIYKDFSDI